ncbi:MAG: TRAP transporter large permease subunit, partial [Actinomycetaceae bacterium]|nr:TRAP transporter large permease subunit [Actinomycetaceae bacterium]
LALPKPLIVAVVCLLVIIVATPLSSTATVSAIGVPALAVLVATDIPVVIAVITIQLCSSTEGASLPAGAPIYLASGLAETEPVKTFVPLILYFVLPIAALAWLVGMGFLPIPQVG